MKGISADAWGRKAACSGIAWTESDAIFFPQGETDEQVAVAREKFCDRCPISTDCLNEALGTGQPGIFAGTSTDARKKLRRTRHRVKCPLCLAREVVWLEEATGYDSELCLACGVSWATDARPKEAAPEKPKEEAVPRDARSGRILRAAA